jgi:phage regulator Rha-like protein
MNRKGFFMLVSSFKSAKADRWKSKFYDAFEAMEKQLKEQNSVSMDNVIDQYQLPRTRTEAIRNGGQLKIELTRFFILRRERP